MSATLPGPPPLSKTDTFLKDYVEPTMKFIKNINKEMIVVLIWFVVILKLLLNQQPEKLFEKGYLLYPFLGFPLLFIIFRIFNFYDDKKGFADNTKGIGAWFSNQWTSNPTTIIAKIVGFLLFVAFFFWSVDSKNSSTILTDDVMVFLNIIMVTFVIIALMVVFRVFKSVINSIEGWGGIIGRLLFFIPCAISDFFFYLMGQFTKSPFVVYVLIAIEIALILLYIYLPKLFKTFVQSAATELYRDPLLLKNEQKLGNYNKMINEKIVTVTPLDQKFSLSMWFYVVGMPTNKHPYNGEATIFKLANNVPDTTGKFNYHPHIVYDGSKNLCKVYCSKVDTTEFKITLQKWVHFVITYSSDVIDIFINGELIKSVPRTKDSVIFDPADNAVVGQTNGLYGGICNIQYFGRAITKREITMNYELNKGLDPPTN
jgi:hypothetical protein